MHSFVSQSATFFHSNSLSEPIEVADHHGNRIIVVLATLLTAIKTKGNCLTGPDTDYYSADEVTVMDDDRLLLRDGDFNVLSLDVNRSDILKFLIHFQANRLIGQVEDLEDSGLDPEKILEALSETTLFLDRVWPENTDI